MQFGDVMRWLCVLFVVHVSCVYFLTDSFEPEIDYLYQEPIVVDSNNNSTPQPWHIGFNGLGSTNCISFIGVLKAHRDTKTLHRLTDVSCMSWSSCLSALLLAVDAPLYKIDQILTSSKIIQPEKHYELLPPHLRHTRNNIWERLYRYLHNAKSWMKNAWTKIKLKTKALKTKYLFAKQTASTTPPPPQTTPSRQLDITDFEQFRKFLRVHVFGHNKRLVELYDSGAMTLAKLHVVTNRRLTIFTSKNMCDDETTAAEYTLNNPEQQFCQAPPIPHRFDRYTTPLDKLDKVLYNMMMSVTDVDNNVQRARIIVANMRQQLVENSETTIAKIFVFTPTTPRTHHLYISNNNNNDDDNTLHPFSKFHDRCVDDKNANIEFETFENCHATARHCNNKNKTLAYTKFLDHYFREPGNCQKSNNDYNICKNQHTTNIQHIALETMILYHSDAKKLTNADYYFAARHAFEKSQKIFN